MITKVTITYKETRSFGNHHNVTSEITMENTDHDDVDSMAEDARIFVQHQIDKTLMENGEAPVYLAGQRYKIVYARLFEEDGGSTYIQNVIPNDARVVQGYLVGTAHALLTPDGRLRDCKNLPLDVAIAFMDESALKLMGEGLNVECNIFESDASYEVYYKQQREQNEESPF